MKPSLRDVQSRSGQRFLGPFMVAGKGWEARTLYRTRGKNMNMNYGGSPLGNADAYNQKSCDPLPPQQWTADVASALGAVTSDLSVALDALRNLDGRLFGFAPEPAMKGNSADKPQSIAEDFSDRLSTLRELAEVLMSRAQRLNNRI